MLKFWPSAKLPAISMPSDFRIPLAAQKVTSQPGYKELIKTLRGESR